MNDKFARNVWLSVGLHVGLIVLILLRAITMPTENLQIRDAIRVDVVALPQKVTEPQIPNDEIPPDPKAATPPPAAEAPSEPEPAPAPPKKVVALKPTPKPKDVAKSQSSALAKLKALEMLDKFKNDVAKENTPKPKPIKGNQISAGNALSGIERVDYDKYFNDIRTQVFSHWSLPTWMADAEFKATVTVMIDEQGYVTKKVMRHSSGNEIFDAKAIEAIEASSPFTPPPERLRGVLATTGINFNFPQ